MFVYSKTVANSSVLRLLYKTIIYSINNIIQKIFDFETVKSRMSRRNDNYPLFVLIDISSRFLDALNTSFISNKTA